MAFNRVDETQKKPGLIPLVDVIFLLLIFFLVASFVRTGARKEQKLTIPTPVQKEGAMDILVQLFKTQHGELRAYFISSEINEVYRRIYQGLDERFPTITDDQIELTKNVFEVVRSDYNLSTSRLKERLAKLKSSKTPVFIGIRCPYDVPYFKVIELKSTIPLVSQYKWPIRYGFIEGDEASLFNARIIPDIKDDKVRSILIDLQ